MSVVRAAAKRLLPSSWRDAFRKAWRWMGDAQYRGHQRRVRLRALRHRELARIQPRLWEQTGGRIASGPFAGLHYVQQAVGSAWAPKLVGAYEKELWPVVEDICTRHYDLIVDIGSAEGYYAVGLAKRLPACRMVCFEADPAAHPILQRFAADNGVSQPIQTHGLCTAELLEQALSGGGRVLVVCDVEGAEREILDPSKVPSLTGADILVELHHFVHPTIDQDLGRRFARTHQIHPITSKPRQPADWPATLQLEEEHKQWCLDEDRPGPMTWFWMTVR